MPGLERRMPAHRFLDLSGATLSGLESRMRIESHNSGCGLRSHTNAPSAELPVLSECGAHLSITVRVGRELAKKYPRGPTFNPGHAPRSVTTLMSGGAPIRTGGPQKPAPRET